MTTDEYKNCLSVHSNTISQIAKRLLKNNSDYSFVNIRSMIHTAIWEHNKITLSGVYLIVLNRILEEKGYRYYNNQLEKPFINVEYLSNLSINEIHYEPDKKNYNDLVNEIISSSGLNQEEVFVISLSSGLSTPDILQGKYKEILEDMESIYYTRSLTQKEVADIMQISVKRMKQYRKTAWNKIRDTYEATPVRRTVKY